MKQGLSVLMLVASVPFASFAETHHDIKVPSLQAGHYTGPIRSIEREYSYDMSDRKYTELSLYNEAGDLQSRTRTNSKGKFVFSLTNTFNEAGCYINEQVEDYYEKRTNDFEIVLNAPTRKIAYKCRLTGTVEIATYDEHGYRISYTRKKRGKKTLTLTAYKRRDDHRSAQYIKYNDDGRVKYVSVYDWNDKGQLARSLVTYKSEKKKTLYEYEYLAVDPYGNWTQRLLQAYDMLDNKKKKYEKFETRTFEYYDEN